MTSTEFDFETVPNGVQASIWKTYLPKMREILATMQTKGIEVVSINPSDSYSHYFVMRAHGREFTLGLQNFYTGDAKVMYAIADLLPKLYEIADKCTRVGVFYSDVFAHCEGLHMSKHVLTVAHGIICDLIRRKGIQIWTE